MFYLLLFTLNSSPGRVLDAHCDNVATKNNLVEQHVELDKKEQAFMKALESKNVDSMKSTYAEFEELNLAHLKLEEDFMMPSVMSMVKAGKPMKKFMIEEILANVKEDEMEFFIKYANRVLEQHSGGQPRVRVFDHALYAVATPEQWKLWDSYIKDTVNEKTYGELQAVIS